MKRACMRRSWTLIRMREFFPACQSRQLMASSIWMRLCLVLLPDFHCKENLVSMSYLYTQDSSTVIMVFMKSRSLFVESSMSCESWVYGYDPEPVIFLTMKTRREPKHYLTQMLLAINRRYWQEGNNSRMRMKIQGRLMQALFIKIHQDFVAKNKVG